MNDASAPRHTAPDTIAVTAGRPPHTPDAPLNPPLVLAATYAAGGDLEYGRYGNPVWQAFEEVLGELEGGRALVFASGMAAANALLDTVPDGAAIAAPRHAYLGVLALVEQARQRGRVEARTLEVADTDTIRATAPNAAMVWLESPTNPALEVADLSAACAVAHEHGAVAVVDNTFATPLLQRPLDLGADAVLHSATKFLAGHSDVQLGAIVTRNDALYDRLDAHRRAAGAIPGPFETWLALRGIRTLHLRVERAQENAGVLAQRLAGHQAVQRVRYPGLPDDPGHARATEQMAGYGAIVCIELADAETADAMCKHLRLWVNSTSLGGVESTLERRRRWPGEPTTIPEGLLRLSVGVENVDDLWADLAQALDAVAT
ncbi:MAG: aminotransferase class I/II-fold pyridoxal phosphate-dependent enzyme [Streptosporangiales bacterium]|nr:aminotransferase class I/II-fold pyridoxal phosphate-dependent enzyme [Streptosporangiales bacterium]